MYRRSMLVKNEVDGMLQLKEFQSDNQLGDYGYQVQVPFLRRRKILSSIFKNRNRHSLRTSEIVIFINGVEFEKSLVPEDFVFYSQLIFQFDGHRCLKVMGVSAPANLFYLSRRWLGFLGGKSKRGAELIFSTTPRNDTF